MKSRDIREILNKTQNAKPEPFKLVLSPSQYKRFKKVGLIRDEDVVISQPLVTTEKRSFKL